MISRGPRHASHAPCVVGCLRLEMRAAFRTAAREHGKVYFVTVVVDDLEVFMLLPSHAWPALLLERSWPSCRVDVFVGKRSGRLRHWDTYESPQDGRPTWKGRIGGAPPTGS